MDKCYYSLLLSINTTGLTSHPFPNNTLIDNRFFTLATTPRELYRDIKLFLWENYPEGQMNLSDDQDDEFFERPVEEVIKSMFFADRVEPLISKVVVISDPDDVSMIDQAVQVLGTLQAMIALSYDIYMYKLFQTTPQVNLHELAGRLRTELRQYMQSYNPAAAQQNNVMNVMDLDTPANDASGLNEAFIQAYSYQNELRAKMAKAGLV